MSERVKKLSQHLTGDVKQELGAILANMWRNEVFEVGNRAGLREMLVDMSLEDARIVCDILYGNIKKINEPACFKLGWKDVFEEIHCLYAPLPMSGVLLESDATVNFTKHHIFCAEAEFAFVLSENYTNPHFNLTESEIKQNISEIYIAIELCGCRINTLCKDLGISASLTNYVSDGLLGSKIVKGPRIFSAGDSNQNIDEVLTNIEKCDVSFYLNEKLVSFGTTSSNPFNSAFKSFSHLINTPEKTNMTPGSLVIAGHCCQIAFSQINGTDNISLPNYIDTTVSHFNQEALPGSKISAKFSNYGEVNIIIDC